MRNERQGGEAIVTACRSRLGRGISLLPLRRCKNKVRYGSLADMTAVLINVCSWGELQTF